MKEETLEKTTDLNETRGCFISQSGKSSWLQTSSGGRVSVTRPLQKEINFDDIAVALSKQCRFNGHCNAFYSVAQHSVLGCHIIDNFIDVSEERKKQLKKHFVLHDAVEAFLGDMIKPVKIMIPEFKQIENTFEKVIQVRFGLDPKDKHLIKFVDNVMIAWEKRDLLPNSEPWPNMLDINKYELPEIEPWSWQLSEVNYRKIWDEVK